MTDFDARAFLDWLDDQEGSISGETMDEQWPDFPWEYTVGVTCRLDEDTGAVLYYQRDLRRAARGQKPID